MKSNIELFQSLEWDRLVQKEMFLNSYTAYALQFDEPDNEAVKSIQDMLKKALGLDLWEKVKPKYSYASFHDKEFTETKFTDAELEFYESILPHFDDSFLKARLYDILWRFQKPKEIEYAKEAILNYTKYQLHCKFWNVYQERNWISALTLAKKGNLQSEFQKVVEDLETIATQNNQEYSFTRDLVNLLFKANNDSIQNQRLAEYLKKQADKMEMDEKFKIQYLKLAIRISEKLYNKSLNTECRMSLVNLRVEMAEHETNPLEALTLYVKALSQYQAIPREQRDVGITNQIQLKIEALRKSLIDMMQITSKPLNFDFESIKPEIESAKIRIKNEPSFKDALKTLSLGIITNTSKDELRAETISDLKNNISFSLYSTLVVSLHGRKVGTVPSFSPSDLHSDENEKAIEMHMILKFNWLSIPIKSYGYLQPALESIQENHAIDKAVLEELCKQSPLVPEHREKSVATGLYFGFQNDFLEALHILCPQLEHMIRMQLKKAGVNTISRDPSGTEDEKSLNALVKEPEFVETFGEDVAFEIKALFLEKVGANLRNEVAHGLFDDSVYGIHQALFAWWYILQLLVKSVATP